MGVAMRRASQRALGPQGCAQPAGLQPGHRAGAWPGGRAPAKRYRFQVSASMPSTAAARIAYPAAGAQSRCQALQGHGLESKQWGDAAVAARAERAHIEPESAGWRSWQPPSDLNIFNTRGRRRFERAPMGSGLEGESSAWSHSASRRSRSQSAF
jgi:hypothetical protein